MTMPSRLFFAQLRYRCDAAWAAHAGAVAARAKAEFDACTDACRPLSEAGPLLERYRQALKEDLAAQAAVFAAEGALCTYLSLFSPGETADGCE